MGEGNHLPVPRSMGLQKGRWTWIFGGTAVAVIATALLMQYVRGTATQAASDAQPAGNAKVAAAAGKTETLARVGDESITYDAVAAEAVKRYGREVLDDLIHRLIIQQACEKNNITVSEQEITAEIERIATRFKLDVANWLQMLQAERNITPVQYRQSVIFPMIALKKLVGDEVDVTEKEMKEAFVRNYGPRVKARMIMFDNQRRAAECLALVQQNPEDFEQLATKHSVDPGSRALGGQIPPIARFSGNEYLEAMEKAAFKMKEGDISAVIEVAPSRYVVLKCEGRTVPVVESMDEVRDALYDELKESKIQAQVAAKFEQIKKSTLVDNYLTQTTNRPERTAGSAGPNGAGAIQPVSATRQKSAAAPDATAKPQKTSSAPAKTSKN